MGHMLSKKFIKTQNVLLLGLDSSGKTTFLYRLYQGVVMDTLPTVGFNVVTIEMDKKTTLTVWDIGGQDKMQPNWKYHLEGCEALVFVVDATDRARMDDAGKALKKVLKDPHMTDVPLLVLANKSDRPDAMTVNEVSKELDMESYKDRIWEIQACSALKGLGVQQAFRSVTKLLQKN
ncbi:ADP-ribosylation factor-like protein 11 [Astyanax mexicanus]|uniref:ADP-ribosylation factor-like protein 14 n=1 Tax=Astyanax mexicanus TaxID=7994 RepID=A0A8B9KNP3_ASTMX|nr:ADP-ribosylation factor-like protein 11 [Astyanax mexicanus]